MDPKSKEGKTPINKIVNEERVAAKMDKPVIGRKVNTAKPLISI